MHKIIAALSATCVLAAGGVCAASPIKGGFSVSDRAQSAPTVEFNGIVAYLLNQAATTITSTVLQASAQPVTQNAPEQQIVPTDAECDAKKGAQNPDPDKSGDEEETHPAGPEPMYFGF